jgi:hypothetical protein
MPTPASFKDFPVLPGFYPDHQQPRMEVPSFRTERSRIVNGPVSSVLLQCIVMHWAGLVPRGRVNDGFEFFVLIVENLDVIPVRVLGQAPISYRVDISTA